MFSPEDLIIDGGNWPILKITFQSLVGKPIGGNLEVIFLASEKKIY